MESILDPARIHEILPMEYVHKYKVEPLWHKVQNNDYYCLDWDLVYISR